MSLSKCRFPHSIHIVFILSPITSAAKIFSKVKSQHFELNVKSLVMDVFSSLDAALNKNGFILFQ